MHGAGRELAAGQPYVHEKISYIEEKIQGQKLVVPNYWWITCRELIKSHLQ